MSEQNETLADIVAEMRHGFDQSWHDIDREWAHELADRIEAAAERLREMSKNVSKNGADFGQFGNAAAMREVLEAALKTIRGVINGTISRRSNTVFDCRDKLSAALAKPPRNCDVGTAEEQAVRFRNYCWNHSSRDKNMECQCPIDAEGKAGCKLTWAQMPCDEKGGAICG